MDRFSRTLNDSSKPVPSYYPGYTYWDSLIVQAEMDIITDWILRFGTPEQKDVLIETLQGLIPQVLSGPPWRFGPPERLTLIARSGAEWIVRRASCAQDQRLIGALENARSRLGGTDEFAAIHFLLRAEAACGSIEAQGAVLRGILEDESYFVPQGQATTANVVLSLNYSYPGSLRVEILRKRDAPYEQYPMRPEISDATIRSAISKGGCSQWYTLYLLAEIKKPQAADEERLLQMWDGTDIPTSLVVVDVLYAWGDWQTLVMLYGHTQAAEVKSEIAWALAELGIPQAAAIVEEQLRCSWNPQWIALGKPFPRLVGRKESLNDSKAIEVIRTAEAARSYFHPEFKVLDSDFVISVSLEVMKLGTLDEERFAALKGVAADHDIHPGMRFDLIGSDYGTTDWGKPLIREAAAEALRTYPSAPTVGTIASTMSPEFVVDVCAESISDESLRSLMLSLLASGDGYYYPVIEELLWEVWSQRYIQTEGQSILFREPGNLGTSIDYYCAHCYSRTYPRMLETVLGQLVRNDSLPAGYRAFILIYWSTAYGSFSREFVENLLHEDMPEFIREALQQRLANWPDVTVVFTPMSFRN